MCLCVCVWVCVGGSPWYKVSSPMALKLWITLLWKHVKFCPREWFNLTVPAYNSARPCFTGGVISDIWHRPTFSLLILWHLNPTPMACDIIKATHESNSDSICSSPSLNSCRANGVETKSVRTMPTYPTHLVLVHTYVQCPAVEMVITKVRSIFPSTRHISKNCWMNL